MFDDQAQEGKWTWADGSLVSDPLWAEGEPNNDWFNEDCAITNRLGAWNDINCENSYKFACQIVI